MRLDLPDRVMAPLLVAAVLVLISLGWWQWSRHVEKRDLEARLADRAAAPALTLDEARALPPADLDYRRVVLTGTWDAERFMVIGNRFREGRPGEEVVGVLRGAGSAVLVDLGWYPAAERGQVLDALRVEASARTEGLVRLAPGAGRRGASGAWSGFDVARMSATLPYEAVPWGVIAGSRTEGAARTDPPYPAGGWRPFENQIPHEQYALTWWGLAGALIVTAGFAYRSRRRRILGLEATDPTASL